MLFIACASVSCASREIEPSDIAPVENRFTISDAGSTSSSGMLLAVAEAEARRAASPLRAFSSFTRREYSSYVSAEPERTACCSFEIVSGFQWWCSPSRRHA